MATIKHNVTCGNSLSHSIGKIIEVKWGNIVGDINKQKDLVAYIETILLKYPTLEEFTQDLDKKVDKIEGYGLSKNDFTDVLKALYDEAVILSHTHQNKAVLDEIDGFKSINGETIIGEGNIEIKGEGIEDAPKDGKQYARKDGDWSEVEGGSEKPEGGWKKEDLSEDVQESLDKADNALPNTTFIPTKTSDLENDSGFINQVKTINGESILGEGNIEVEGVTDYNELENRPFEVIDDSGILSLKVNNTDNPNITDGKAGIAALGYSNVANGYGSFVGGTNNFALGARSFAMGRYNNANGNVSTALGSYGAAIKSYDFSIGGYIYETVTLDGSDKTYKMTFSKGVAENGYWAIVGNVIVGTKTTIIESVTKVSNAVYNITTRDDLGTLANSSVKLNVNIASGGKSLAAMGGVSSGTGSIALGWKDFAIGAYSTALGLSNRVQGDYSAAQGYGNITMYPYSYALGSDNQITANSSVALGISNRVQGYNNIACGLGLTTKNSQEVAVGIANKSTQSDDPNEATAFSVGIGNDTANKNGLEIKKSGKILGQDGKEIAYKDDITPITPNIIKYGDLVITDGQLSNFSATNYAQFPFLVDLSDKAFEITMQITTSADVTTQQNILDSQDGLAFAVRNGQFVLAVSNNGIQWAFEAVGGIVSVNTTYLIKLGWNKSIYNVIYSVDNGTTWTDAISQSSTLSPYPRTMFIGKDLTNRYIFGGSINLNKCTLAINGQYVWDGMTDAGLLTRLDTSLSNIDANGETYLNGLIDSKIGDIDNALKLIIGEE